MTQEIDAWSVLVTEDCNLACKYCYEITRGGQGHNKKKMSVETAKAAVDFMFESAPNAPEIIVSFFGGEPCLMPEIIDTMMTRGKELSKIHNKRFIGSMITNATIMNKELYEVLSRHKDAWGNTQLSIDGPEEIQDEYRVTKGGQGSFKMIKKNMPYWKALYGKQLNIHGVLNKKSIPKLFDSYLYFKEQWKEDALWFLPAKADDYTAEDVMMYDQQLGKIYEYVMDIVRKEGRIDELRYYAPLSRAVERDDKPGMRGKPCGAGASYGVITSQGDIWPCHHFYYVDKKKELYLGNIYDGIDKNRKRIWDEYDSSDVHGCEGCEHNACYRCPAENWEHNGSPVEQIKGYHCQFMFVDLKYQNMIRQDLKNMGMYPFN